ncbi:MAG TPA: FG-GAP-like repeat-containing protein, partial [Vicinamibacterales bacterium]
EGIALIQAQDLAGARDTLLDATRRQPQDARAWYNLGLAYRTLGESDAAIDAFERVAQIDRNDADTLYFLGRLHAQAGRYEQAIARFVSCLELDMRHVSAEFGLARAYQRSGNTSAAAQHLARFDELSKSGRAKPISSVYGEQGPYSTAEAIAGIEPAPTDFSVRFTVDARSGLPRDLYEMRTMNGVLAQLGSGACFTDIDADGRPDILLLSGAGHAMLFRNTGGRFTDITARAGLKVGDSAYGCTAGDYDNDGRDDLVIGFSGGIIVYRNQGGTFRDVTSTLGVRVSGPVTGVSFLDYDHDGDLDLYVPRFTAEGSPNRLLRNNGNGTFTDATGQAGLAGDAAGFGLVAADLDNDRAIDVVMSTYERPPLILRNPREGAFEPSATWRMAAPPAAVGAVAADFNKDGWMDLAFTAADAPAVSVWKNGGGARFDRLEIPEIPWTRAWGIVAVDVDNDGWLDLAAVGDGTVGSSVRVLRNLGGERFVDVTGRAVPPVTLAQPRALIAGDTDGDGDADLLVTQTSGPAVLLRNDGGNRRGSVNLAFRGLADNRSGIGTKVEVFAGGLRQKWELQSSSGYFGQSAPGILAGIGDLKQADIVRLLWATGVVQDEVNLPSGRRHLVNE